MDIDQITEEITPLDEVVAGEVNYYQNIANRNNALVTSSFPQVNTVTSQINTTTSQINTVADEITIDKDVAVQAKDDAETAAFNAQSASNYQGDWSLTPPLPAVYPYPQGVSVTVGDVFYYSKIDNNTDVPPSVNWQKTISVVTPPTTTPTSVTSAQNITIYLDIDDWQENYIYDVNNVNPTESQAVVVGNQVAITTQNVVASSVSTIQLNVTIPNIGTSEYTNITVNLNYIPIEADGIINNADFSANESSNTNFDYIAGGMESNADSAIYTENITSQGSLTISSPTTTSIQVVEDVTGLSILYVLNTENTSDYLAVTVDSITGSVGSQVIDFTTAGLVSAPTDASSETKWSNQNDTGLFYEPKEIIVDVSSNSSTLVTFTPCETNDDVLIIKADNSVVAGVLGTVLDGTTYSAIGVIADTIETHTTDIGTNGTASVSSFLSSNYEAWKAVDDTFDQTHGWLANGDVGEWWQYQWNTAKVCGKITLTESSNSTAWMCTGFDLKASNTGAFGGEEVTLTQETGLSWSEGETKTFTFANNTAYTYYRVVMTGTPSTTGQAGYEQIELMESVVSKEADISGLSVGETPSKAYFDNNIDVYIDVQNTAGQINMPVNGIQMTKGILTYDGTKFTQPFTDMTLSGRVIQREIRASKAETKIYEPLNTTMYKEGS